MKFLWAACFYLVVACWILLPGFSPNHILGGESSDLWNTLWGVDFVWSKILAGEFPYETKNINLPAGGTIWIADYLGALMMGPLVLVFGWSFGYQLWLIIQATLLGLCTHGFALDLGAKNRAYIAGLGCMFSGSFLSAIQNGASEGIGLFWVVLSVWMIWRANQEKISWTWAVLIALLGGLSSWYSAVMIGVFWLTLLFPFHKRTFVSMSVWFCAMLPCALWSSSLSQGEQSLIRIKTPALLQQLRRSIGPADPLSYIAPYPFQFPDFSIFWRLGDDYVHSCYIGWIVMGCVILRWKHITSKKSMTVAIVICFLLSLGPVLIHNGQAVVFGEDWWGHSLGVPLPYFLLESVWGFSDLSLLHRLSFGVTLGCCLFASLGLSQKPEWIVIVIGLMMLEQSFWSPVRAIPEVSKVPNSPGFALLAQKPKGVVLNHPVERGTPYLFEQTLHHHLLTISINMEDSNLGQHLWDSMEKNGCSRVRYTRPVYIVHHRQIEHRPQREDRLMEKAIEECSIQYRDEDLIIVELK